MVDAPKPEQGEPFDHLRQLGIDAATNDLVLFIDADERHPKALQERLQELKEQPTEDIGVVRAPILNYLGNKQLSGGLQSLGYTPTLLNPEKVELKKKVHSFLEYDEDDAYDLEPDPELAVRHQLAESLYEHWQAQRRYAKIAGSNREFKLWKLFLSPPWGIYHHVIENQGWKDGFIGIGIGICYGWFLFESQLRGALSKFYF
ncbi:glycosyltransferase involved in cell wall biosynthesis [Halorubrum trapanicum]|uniref:Glycosyltransferase involved in cell wall biosynthesis n=1 Tax=Halorubrum trapanicum TaxID=29284 RepID=A0A8J7UM12_9EURY|nr:glycosyltransferase involved in cell wall biosynthesis [Halorubrum trapanicum]